MIFFNRRKLNINLRKHKEERAFSLIEVIVSISIFSIIILSMTSIFKMVIDAQRKAIASQNVQESMKYFLEVINKEIRMAVRSDGDCFVPSGMIYAVSSSITEAKDTLFFKNRYGQCVQYYVTPNNNPTNANRFTIVRDSVVGYYISPAKIKVSSLKFNLSQGANLQDLVTIKIEAEPTDLSSSEAGMILQTSLSSRYYRDK